jgi:hypothetical protein
MWGEHANALVLTHNRGFTHSRAGGNPLIKNRYMIDRLPACAGMGGAVYRLVGNDKANALPTLHFLQFSRFATTTFYSYIFTISSSKFHKK